MLSSLDTSAGCMQAGSSYSSQPITLMENCSSSIPIVLLCFASLLFKSKRFFMDIILAWLNHRNTVSVFKILWLLINLCHQTIIFYLISTWNVKIVSALLLAVLSSLVCSLSQKKKKKKRKGEIGKRLHLTSCNACLKQQVLQTGYFHVFLGVRWLKYHHMEIFLSHDLMTNVSWKGRVGKWNKE